MSRKLSEIKKADKIILPGVGSFDQCMNRIRKIRDLVETLKFQVITKKKIIFRHMCRYANIS